MLNKHKLHLALSQAAKTLKFNERGHLPLPYRLEIWWLLDEEQKIELTLKLIKAVLPLWNEVFEDSRVKDLIDLCSDLRCQRHNNRAEIERVRLSLSEDLQDYQFSDYEFSGYCVARAIIKAATLVLGDDSHTPALMKPTTEDYDLDPENLDAIYFVASAYSEGYVGDKDSSTEKRKEFWTRYLGEVLLVVN